MMQALQQGWQIEWLGRVEYAQGLALQQEALEQLLRKREKELHDGKPLSPNSSEVEGILLLLEHEAVYTMGRRLDQRSLFPEGVVAGEEKEKTPFLPYPLHQVGRGGEATYHGPGQLIAYPIFHLDKMGRDLHRYLRFLEEVIIKVLAFYGISGGRRDGMTGVWVEDRKIASLGVGVRKWIAYHGLALNVGEDLSGFNAITPCGLTGVTMTSVSLERHRLGLEELELTPQVLGNQLASIFLKELQKVM